MKNKFIFCSFISVGILFAACTRESLRGSGDQKTETRTLPAFEVVHFSGIREAEIIESAETKVELTGYANLVNIMESRVSNGHLYFSYPGYYNIKNDNVKLRIYTGNLKEIYQSGSAKVKVGAGFSWDALRVFQSGRCHLEIAGGTANRLLISGSGESKVFAKPVAAGRVEMDLSGNAYAEVWVTGYLKVDASGRVRVKYWGSPTETNVKTSGEARVERQ